MALWFIDSILLTFDTFINLVALANIVTAAWKRQKCASLLVTSMRMIFFYYLSPSLAVQVVLSWQFLCQHQACKQFRYGSQNKTWMAFCVVSHISQSYQLVRGSKFKGCKGRGK